MSTQVKVKIDVLGTVNKINDPKFWTFAANEYHKLLTPYVPMDSGTLSETVKTKGGEGNGEIEYYAPYAHYIYEGKAMGPSFFSDGFGFWSPPGERKHYTGKKLNISKSKHPLASTHWDEAAEPTQRPKLIEAMQSYIDSGRLKFE